MQGGAPEFTGQDPREVKDSGSANGPASEEVARALGSFGPVGLGAIVLILAGNYVLTPLSAVLALFWAWCSRTPWREIGYVWPQSWVRTTAGGLLFGARARLPNE